MDQDKFLLLIQGCRDEYLSQESLNREFSLKAIGIATFSIAVHSAAISIVFQKVEEIDYCVWVIFSLISISLLAALVFALKVAIPKRWERPFDTKQLKGAAVKLQRNILVDRLGENYSEAIAHNKKVLTSKTKSLKWLIQLTAAQFILYVVLFLYLFFPGVLP